MIAFVWSLMSFIVALGILVAVHEWGHFYVARRCGVKVERFSIGFGKPLWRTHDKHGTEFVIAAIPLGGYVRMLDERVDQVSEADLPYAFNRQSVGKRIAIIAAGPLTNFIFAIFALLLMYLIGLPTVKPVIGNIEAQSIAAQAGLPDAGEITAIGGQQTADWEDVNLELVSHIGKDAMQVTVLRTEGYTQDYTLDLRDWSFDPDSQSALASLGIQRFTPDATTEITYVAENSAAQRAGFNVGDKIIAMDGTLPQNWQQIVDYVSARPGQMLRFEVGRGGDIVSLDATIGTRENDPSIGYLGLAPRYEEWPEGHVFIHQYNPISALLKATDKTWRWMTLSVEMIGKLITGDVSVKNLSGPISIAQGAGVSAGYGLVYFLSFLALISVNLGIINLLPLPMLDGGHLLYYFIELLTGRPVPESVQEVGFKVGGVLLLMLMSIAIFNDIARLS
ncbi:sigma E protease regulator RseP [Aestuariibacter salexigens]|uniref:sigma E protease regulator RseP n=1 Tax=Aestuariibacter salexigens TaxID=226010 RepID=UPI000426B3B5|nr:sigma E protease regulator RseP [Aestuariibacter salexigens]